MDGFTILTVTQINSYLKSYIDENKKLSGIYIKGEITDFKANFYSGHFYFSLKDDNSEIKCVMFKSYAQYIRFLPENGMNVIVRCDLSVYQKSCACQLYVYDIQPNGIGAKHLEFEQLKEKLQREGLFDAQQKRSLPPYPEKIGIISSANGAALQDIINILTRRWPLTKLVLTPSAVQGEDASRQLLLALKKQNCDVKPDVIIIGRGGGSNEDLSAFNDEALARAIYECKIPVVSAVGHETDFSICDFVADLRAPTPSAAAELVSPDMNVLHQSLDENIEYLHDIFEKKCDNYAKIIDKFISVKSKHFTDKIVKNRIEKLEFLTEGLGLKYKNMLIKKSDRYAFELVKLDHNNPAKLLSKTICRVEKNGKQIRSVFETENGESLNLYFADGRLKATITEKTERGVLF